MSRLPSLILASTLAAFVLPATLLTPTPAAAADSKAAVSLPRDVEASWRQQAEKGDASAQYKLGLAYHIGFNAGGPDYAQAFNWFKKAAEKGHAEAMFKIGEMHARGQGRPRNPAEAYAWNMKSAAKGYPHAEYFAYVYLLTGTGTTKDEKKAMEWLQKAATHGWANAQYRLGRYYDSGAGFSKDSEKALAWIRKAAAQNHPGALGYLGMNLLEEAEATDDYREAVRVLTAGADLGDLTAQMFLGTLYLTGMGVTQNHVSACTWLTLASMAPAESVEDKRIQEKAREMLDEIREGLDADEIQAANLRAAQWIVERKASRAER